MTRRGRGGGRRRRRQGRIERMTRRGKGVEEAWSHLYWGGVVVVVALEPGLLPVGHQVNIIIEKKN